MRSCVSRSTSVEGSPNFGPDFLGIEHVKQHDFVAVEAQRLDGPHDVFRRIVKIGNEHDDAAAPQELLKMFERLGEIGARVRLGLFQAAEQPMQLSLPRGGPDVGANFIVEDDQARGVALILNRQIEKRGRREARVIHLAHGVRGELHGVAGVEQHGEDAVGFAAIALQVGALGAGEDVPIHVAQVVARRVRAVFGEFLAEAEIRRAVQAGDEAVDDGLRHQIQAGNSGEHRRDRESVAAFMNSLRLLLQILSRIPLQARLIQLLSFRAKRGFVLIRPSTIDRSRFLASLGMTKTVQQSAQVLPTLSTAAACIPAVAAKFHPNRCGPIQRGNSAGCGGAAPGSPAPVMSS